MAKFHDRLAWCMKHGSMSKSDIAHWLKLQFGTVNNWFLKKSEPRGVRVEPILRLLGELEEAIKKKRGFPIPFEISVRQRPAYIEQIRDGHSRTVSKPRAAKKRASRRSDRRNGARPKRTAVQTKRRPNKAKDSPAAVPV